MVAPQDVTPADGEAAPGTEPAPLHRGLRTLGTVLITLSAITPASSVFIIAPGVISSAGTGAFLSFVGAGVVGIFMAFVYAELASAYPLAGGEYSAVGRTLGRAPGFMIMGLLLVTQVLIVAVIALGVATYLGVIVDLNGPATAAVVVLLCAVVGILDITVNAWVTGIFLAIEMVALVVVSVLGFAHAERSVVDLVTDPVAADGSGGLTSVSIGLIGSAMVVSIFAYNGYGSTIYLGEETHDARRNMGRAILWALGITVAAELIPVTAVLVGAPSLEGLFGADSMLTYFVTERGGDDLNTVLSLAVALAIINAALAILLLTSRMIFSTGRDEAWPGGLSRQLASVHPKFRSPWVATGLAGVAAAAVCFVDDHTLLVLTGTAIVVVYAALCLAAIAGRLNGSTRHGFYRMPLFPLPPLAGLVALGYVIYENSKDSDIGRPSLVVTAVILGVSLAYYLIMVRRRGLWVLRGPTDPEESAGT